MGADEGSEKGDKDRKVGEIGEEALVARLTAGLRGHEKLRVGPGDDCAAVETGDGSEWLLLKTDCVIERVHFAPATDPVQVGRKAMSRSVSDVAAMGGRPEFALVTVASDSGRKLSELEGWYEGMESVAAECGIVIVGGETSRLADHGAVISVSLTGRVERDLCVTRAGARIGDFILVTGRLGGSFESGRHLDFRPRLAEGQWLARHARPTAMMDLSDGLGSDLPRLAKASGTGYQVNLDQVPCHDGVAVERAISDGEDYELLLTVAPDSFNEWREAWDEAFPDCELTRIGTVSESTENRLERGWEHHRDPT